MATPMPRRMRGSTRQKCWYNNQAINKALQEPDLAQRITSMGNVIGGGSSQDFASFIATESARWAKLIKERNIQGE